MKLRFRHISLVIDFLDIDFDTKYIDKILKQEADKLLQVFSFPTKLNDWEIHFRVIYTNTDCIRIYRRSKSFTKRKYKELAINIPIPLKSVVSWGVNTDQHVKLGYNENFENHTDKLEIDPTYFEDRTSYILACMKKAIQECFELGFTVSGHKVKL